MLQRFHIGTFRPALSFIGLLSFITSFFGSRLFATLNPTIVIQQQGIHFHHFWYGIALMGIAGWLAITWKSERLDRATAHSDSPVRKAPAPPSSGETDRYGPPTRM